MRMAVVRLQSFFIFSKVHCIGIEWALNKLPFMYLIQETVPWISSSAVMETASMQLQSVTTTMIVQTSVMSLDVVSYAVLFVCFILACSTMNTVCNHKLSIQ